MVHVNILDKHTHTIHLISFDTFTFLYDIIISCMKDYWSTN